MALISLVKESCAVIAVDIQTHLLPGIDEAERVIRRSHFVIEAANILGVPVLATAQTAEKLGPIESGLAKVLPEPIEKLSFSCWGSQEFRRKVAEVGARQLIVVGIETHICVGLTAIDLLREGFEVVVCPDAVSAGSLDRHKLGMERIRDAGAVPIHSEAVAYEWMAGAFHPRFRDILSLVKTLR